MLPLNYKTFNLKLSSISIISYLCPRIVTENTGIVNRFLMRLFLVSTLLCGFLGFSTEVKAWGMAGCDQKSEEEVKENDGWLKQMAEEPPSSVEASLRTLPTSIRVVSSRSIRLRPTYGGRTGQHHGRWAEDGCGPFQTSPVGGFSKSSYAPGRASSSPRLYYVIALSRLLC